MDTISTNGQIDSPTLDDAQHITIGFDTHFLSLKKGNDRRKWSNSRGLCCVVLCVVLAMDARTGLFIKNVFVCSGTHVQQLYIIYIVLCIETVVITIYPCFTAAHIISFILPSEKNYGVKCYRLFLFFLFFILNSKIVNSNNKK